MKIAINDRRKIQAIQESFSEMFPYLKIEFFVKPHKAGVPSSKKIMKNSSKTIGECRTVHSNGTMTILPNMTVADLVDGFNETFGLFVRVFRKSGKVWLETSTTVNWTLEAENKAGEEMNIPEVDSDL